MELRKLEDDDIRAPILGMSREVAISRSIRILFQPRRTVTTFSGRFRWLRFSIRSTAWESRLTKDALTTA